MSASMEWSDKFDADVFCALILYMGVCRDCYLILSAVILSREAL